MDSEAVGAWIEAATEEGAGEEGAPGVRLARLWTRWEEEAEAEGAEARGRWTRGSTARSAEIGPTEGTAQPRLLPDLFFKARKCFKFIIPYL